MKTILIVDDIFENLYLLRVVLDKAGYKVIEAKDGKVALDQLENTTVDLIVSDILMPVMDGYMLCQACKKDERFKDIPFVFYTSTYTEKTDEDFALKLGAAHFLRKPTDPDVILELIQKLLDVDHKVTIPENKEQFTDQEVLKLYSKRLISKLEQKNSDLEKEVFERKTIEQKLVDENIILDLIANNTPIKKVFNHIIDNFQSHNQGLMVAISLLDQNGTHLNLISAPKLPKGYGLAIKKLEIGKQVGSCGTAAFTKKPIIVSDISTDKLWVDYKDLALSHNLKSCWSIPILSEKKTVFGTFAIYSNAIKSPSLENIRELHSAVNLAKIAIVKSNILEEIKKKEESYRALVNQASDAILTYTFDGQIHDFNRATHTILGYTSKEFSKLKLQDIIVGNIIETPEIYNQIIKGIAVIFERQLICKNKSLIDVEISAKKQKDGRILSIGRDITERKKDEIKLLESEYNLRQSQIVANIGSFTMDLITRTWECTEALNNVFGIDASFSRTMKNWGRIIHSEDRSQMLSYLEYCIQNNRKIDREYRVVKEDTKAVIWVHSIGEFLFDGNTNPVKIIGTTQDITERKQSVIKLQESEFNLRQSQIVARIGTYTIDLLLNSWESSDILDEIFEIEKTYVRDLDGWRAIIHQDQREKVIAYYKDCIVNKKKLDIEYKAITIASKKEIWVHAIGELVLDADGDVIKVIGTSQDITERKKAEVKIQESEFNLRQSQIVGNIGSYAIDLASMTWTGSIVLYSVFGIDQTYDKTMDGWGERIHPEDRDELRSYLENCISNNLKFDKEYRILKFDTKKEVWVHGIGELILDKEDNPIKLIGTIQDITNRKQSELKLQESEYNLRQSQKVGNIGSYTIDLNTKTWECSSVLDNILGIDASFVKNIENWNTIIHPDERKEIEKYFKDCIINQEKFNKEYRIIKVDTKEIIWVYEIGELILDKEGNPSKVIGTSQDITDRKIAEIKLQESEYDLRQSQIVGNIGSYNVDLQAMTWEGSAVLDTILGIDKSYLKTVNSWNDRIHPEEREEMLNYFHDCILNKSKFNKEYRVVKLNTKAEIWVLGIGELIFDNEGRAIKLIGTIQDITLRKHSEIKLQESERSLKVAQKIAKTGSFNLDIKKLTGETSDTFKDIIGVEYDAIIDFNLWKSIVHPEDKILIKDGVVKSQMFKQKFDEQYRIITKDKKELKWIHGLGEIVYANSKATNFIGTIQDITERKKAEIELKLINEFTDNLVMSLQEGLLLLDVTSKIIKVNESLCNMLGYLEQELLGMTLPYPFVKPEDLNKINDIEQMLTKGEAPSFQLEFIRKNGVKFIASFLSGNIKNDSGEIVAVFATVKDISEDEKLKETLKDIAIKSTEKKDVILKLANLVGQDLDTSLDEITKLAAKTLNIKRVGVWSFNNAKNQLTCEKLYTLEDSKYSSGAVFKYEDNPAYFKALDLNQTILISDAQNNKITKQSLKSYLGPNNITSLMDVFINSATGYYGVICFENVGLPLKQWAAEDQEFATSIASIVSLILESTERKIAETELRSEKEFSEKLVTSLREGLSVVNLEGVHIKVNPALCEMTGFTEEELVGIKAPFPYWPPEEYDNIYKAFDNPLQSLGVVKHAILMRKNGDRFPCTLSDSVIRNSEGKVMAYFTTINDITIRVKAENILKENIIKSDQRKNTIIELANLIGEDFELSLKKITATAATALNVDLVTIWEYKKEKTELLSKQFYNAISQEYETEGLTIRKNDFPKYFEVFEDRNSINIADVVNNPITKAFSETFFIPFNISSRIDVVIYGRYNNYGIISFESTTPKRVFTNDDESFATSIASIVSLMVESKERTLAENKIAQTNTQLLEANKELSKLRNQLEQENVYLRNELDLVFNYEEMVYGSVEFSNVLNEIEKVAPTKATVLLLGESGTGKELLARALHKTSPRSNKPLIKVNCSAIPRELIESELFGHKKGSFTGAFSDKVGKFELADGGTLFLDEIGELPLDMQPKILRFLQEGEIEVVGGSVSKKIDARIIAATNRNLLEEIEKKQFREDLYFRLNVFPIEVPPLRKRKDDIPLLVEHFVDKFNKAYDKTIKYIPDDAMSQLKAYNWPGNIRELENLIERASILSTSETLNIPGFESSNQITKQRINVVDLSLDSVLRNHILQVLEECQWKISGPKSASDILGLKPSTLRDKMSKLEIKKPKKK
ncbi:PAS domain S-box protein [Psychroserpens sp. NJDZ02]|uniref:PAS domain S-box protein n=1 Tax=Psychroserpens sp. NJDZ02 TaxID=2570561 RepID=UPI001F0F58EB|nr:PAS domain S-box protein [Psychroserpens sp. NJDZ02]